MTVTAYYILLVRDEQFPFVFVAVVILISGSTMDMHTSTVSKTACNWSFAARVACLSLSGGPAPVQRKSLLYRSDQGLWCIVIEFFCVKGSCAHNCQQLVYLIPDIPFQQIRRSLATCSRCCNPFELVLLISCIRGYFVKPSFLLSISYPIAVAAPGIVLVASCDQSLQ